MYNFVLDVSSDNDDDDDVLAIKRKNIDIDDIPINVKNDDKKKVSKKKPVTKVAMAKKILKKKIVPNKKITFDEDGQVSITIDYLSKIQNYLFEN
jgi:ATP-dependent RNA helicase DDX10/DBP4